MAVVCPCCNGSNVQRQCAIYEGGTSNIDVGTVGFFGGDGLGIGSARSRGTTQTMLANRTAPPSKRSYLPGNSLILKVLVVLLAPSIVGAVIGTFPRPLSDLLSYAVLAGVGYYWYTVFRFNRFEWPKLFSEWQQLWFCHQCATSFQP